MIHYHGTPVGGDRQGAARFLAGRHCLIPFFRPEDLPVAVEFCQSFVIDNSAFSIWRSGAGRVDVDAYEDFVRQVDSHPSLDWHLIPDAIDGCAKINDSLIDRWIVRGLKSLPVPVWHLHESVDRLDYLACNFRVVALGSSGAYKSPGTPDWWKRMAEAMERITDDGRPKCKLHGLRMLNPDIFTHLPLASADSTNAAMNSGSVSRFGMYKPASAFQRAAVIADRIEAHQSPPVWGGAPMQFELIGRPA